MELHIAWGLLAGTSLLLFLAFLQWLAARRGDRLAAAQAAEGDVSGQVWQVLDQARRITEESV